MLPQTFEMLTKPEASLFFRLFLNMNYHDPVVGIHS
jgi:hypothetical protein